jgi:DNA polymerase III alpha subunit
VVTLAGILATVRAINTKKNNSRMCFASFEDDTAAIELVVFPKLYADTTDLWVADEPLLITGRVDKREDKISVIVEKCEKIDINAPVPEGANYEIDIPRGTSKDVLMEINQVLKNSPGGDHVTIVIASGGGEGKRINLPFTVKYNSVLANKINRILS